MSGEQQAGTDGTHGGDAAAPVRWPDEVDDIIGGDLTAALATTTPAGGTVLTAVAPIGLRDRELGTVGFTTSLGFGKKLTRIRADPRVALAYHARDHGFTDRPGFVLVQGRARVVTDEDTDGTRRAELEDRAAQHMGPLATGWFWDHWLSAYYQDRVLVDVTVTRLLWWPDTAAAGSPTVYGPELPPPPDAQRPPPKGSAARLDPARVARKLAPVHRLTGWRGADGSPMVVPVSGVRPDATGLLLEGTDHVPPGGRRGALLAHDYRAHLVGLRSQLSLGWLDGEADGPRFAPHSVRGFQAPPNKTLLLLANGYLARRGLRRARRAGMTS